MTRTRPAVVAGSVPSTRQPLRFLVIGADCDQNQSVFEYLIAGTAIAAEEKFIDQRQHCCHAVAISLKELREQAADLESFDFG